MSRRTGIGILTTATLIALCFAWTTTESAAQTTPPATGQILKGDVKKGELIIKDGKGNIEEKPEADKTTVEWKEIEEAVKRFQNRDFEGALKLLQDGAKKNPDLPPPQVMMAQFYSQAGSLAGVRGSLEQAVIDIPDDPEAYILMGDIALRERRFTEARMLYRNAEELTARFMGSKKRKDLFEPRILSGQASIEEAQENWSEAQKLLEAALKLEPKNPMALQRLAHSMFKQKNPTEALEKLKEAAKHNPEMFTPEAVLSQFYEQNGDHENAKKWMAEALRLAPKDLRTRLIAGQWALETGQLQDAKTQAAEALKLDPKSLDALVLSGVVAMFLKDYPAAERYFETAHVQSPRNFAAANNLALILADQKDDAKLRRALEYAQSNVQQNPRSAEAASTYGWVLYKLGRYDEAEKAYNVAISGGTAAPDTAYYIACLAYDRGRESQAREWLEIALKSKGPFAMQQEAEALLAKLKK